MIGINASRLASSPNHDQRRIFQLVVLLSAQIESNTTISRTTERIKILLTSATQATTDSIKRLRTARRDQAGKHVFLIILTYSCLQGSRQQMAKTTICSTRTFLWLLNIATQGQQTSHL
jgi:hypothetical protein